MSMDNKEYITKFKRCILEYTNATGGLDLSEEGEDDAAMGGAPADGAPMGGDPNMGGGDPSMGGDPGMGGDPSMDGDPNMGGGAADGPKGFAPQGADPNGGMEGMGSAPDAEMGSDPNMSADPNMNADPNMSADPNMEGDTNGEEDDEYVDVDDLTKSQEEAEKKIDAMNNKFEKLMGAVETLVKQNQERADKEAEMVRNFEVEMEKRNPTPMQRMSVRSAKSAPYAMTPNEYMDNYMPDNYSAEDDNNGADDPQYKITKSDIDNFSDWRSAAQDMGSQSLKDILDF